VSEQRINKNFINLNNEIIQLKAELRKRNKDYIKNKPASTQTESVETAIDHVFSNVISKVLVKFQNVI